MTPKTLSFLPRIAALLLLAVVPGFGQTVASAQSAAGTTTPTIPEIEASFQTFLTEYRHEIKQRKRSYLSGVHPSLPGEMHDFFLDITIDMMKFSDENDTEPKIECQVYNACKVIYPQPNDNWAAQQFIFHNGSWRWLEQ